MVSLIAYRAFFSLFPLLLLLTTVLGYFLAHEVRGATPVYGTFALVIDLLAWIHVGVLFTVLGAEANVVRERRLWPRSILGEGEAG